MADPKVIELSVLAEPDAPADEAPSATPEPAASVALTVVSGPDEGKVYPIPQRGRVQIGRSRTCDVQLQDPLVSRVHATITREAFGYIIYDENSTNGLGAGEPPQRVFFARLEDGMNLYLGSTEIRVAIGDGATGDSARKRSSRANAASRQRSAQRRQAPGRDPRSARRSDRGL